MKERQSKATVTTEHHEDGGHTHTIKYANGHMRTVSFAPDHVLAPEWYSDGTKLGITSRINSAKDVADAERKVDELFDAWDEGKKSLLNEGGSKFTPLVRAVSVHRGLTLETAQAIVDKMSKADQAKVRAIPNVARLVAEYKASDEAAKPKKAKSGDDLLDSLLPSQEVEDAAEHIA